MWGSRSERNETPNHLIDIGKSKTMTVAYLPKSKQSEPNRGAFWKFCVRAAAARTLTAYDIDKLFVDQKFCCAISGIPFDAPGAGVSGKPQPFAPSIDRIVAGGNYEVGNIRLVCNIVNFAMNQWGEDALHRLVDEMAYARWGCELSERQRARGNRT